MTNDVNVEMSTRIKEIREEHGLSQRAFAKEIGISGPSVANIENGARNPSEQTIRMICSTFNVNREWLTDGIEPKYKEQNLEDWATLTHIMEGQSDKKKKLMRMIVDMPDELVDMMFEYWEKQKL